MELNPHVPLEFLDWNVLLRLGVAAILGLLLGLDREIRGHAAGMRTHGIVCFSAAALTVSILNLNFQLDSQRVDALRLYEATGAFIGIVGAGLVVFSRGRLHNLTTAAHLWLASVIGIACGAGQWPLVLIASLISLVMMTLLRTIESKVFSEDRRLDEKDAENDEEEVGN
ncbi:hypothetical protein GCM10011371_19420 [Novosphingobium marinum]|uniref:Protein MgtC n=1 Tax=Novosphingobium marinum TaxID=1514948 RepID=A0A7Y9XX60_9SPHN|nr:MgtC/SapB family protein [Novosphingobium marinum]NYH96055.1 putative Mg2+ transporter-C (MgtC) family protein [Novosphingobium marinum]GGC32096.1 hypothetical protein GCM10011371_19420 [Novosphingobium marinum]